LSFALVGLESDVKPHQHDRRGLRRDEYQQSSVPAEHADGKDFRWLAFSLFLRQLSAFARQSTPEDKSGQHCRRFFWIIIPTFLEPYFHLQLAPLGAILPTAKPHRYWCCRVTMS